jgi:hypothetical protein
MVPQHASAHEGVYLDGLERWHGYMKLVFGFLILRCWLFLSVSHACRMRLTNLWLSLMSLASLVSLLTVGLLMQVAL